MNTIETKILEYLVSHNIYPFSVLYIECCHLLKISFYLQEDIKEFLEVSGNSVKCDNYGYREFPPHTIHLLGITLTSFLRDVGCC